MDRAVEGILRIRREVRARSRNTRESSRRSRRSRGPGPGGQRAWGEPKGLDDVERPPPLEPESLVLDCECKVCFGQVADTVLLPCSHLVLCGVRAVISSYPSAAGDVLTPVTNHVIWGNSGVQIKWVYANSLNSRPGQFSARSAERTCLTGLKSSAVERASERAHQREALLLTKSTWVVLFFW